jgi:hypothetical protein
MAADVVVNEIMYQASSKSEADEWIELHNRGDAPANLENWRLAAGVGHTFAARTLNPGQYLVVAANLAAFQAKYPAVTNVVGGWTGRLSNSQEEIRLEDAGGNRVDTVSYSDQGDWAKRRRGPLDNNHEGWAWVQPASGLGSSLELINSALSNNHGQNWAASLTAQGTPGAVNSVRAANIAPLILDVAHGPLVPTSGESVTISARLVDELGSAQSATLHWRVDGAGSGFDTVAMSEGAGGVWTATIPPQSDKAVVEYYVSATDGSRTRTWPAPTTDAGAQQANALYQVDDTPYNGNQPLYKLIMTAAERAELATIGGRAPDRDSNAKMNATFIAIDSTGSQLRYLTGVRNRGHGSRQGPPNNYHVVIPADRPWKGLVALNFNIRDVHNQVMGSAIWRMAGFAVPENLPAQLRVNGLVPTNTSGQYALVEEPDSRFADNHFPDDANGNYYAAFRLDPTLVPEAELQWLGSDPDSYRALYQKGTNAEVDDYSDLIRLVDVLNNTPANLLVQEASKVLNLDQWLRYLALDNLMLNRETGLVRGIGDDYGLYRGEVDKRFVLVPHDLDTIMGQGMGGVGVNQSIFAVIEGVSGETGASSQNGVAGLQRLLTHPDVVARYYRAYLDLIKQVFNPTVLNPLIDQTIGNFADPARIANAKAFVVNRTNAVLNQIPRAFAANSALPTVDGYKKTTVPAATVSGSANASLTKSVMVNGLPAVYNPRTGAWSITHGSGGGGGNTVSLIGANAVWKYKDDGSDQGTGWIGSGFDDSTWLSGPAQLGYSEGQENDEATLINGGPVGAHHITTYFRRTFQVSNKAALTSLTARLLVDDGAIIYLNGSAIPAGWYNMPTNGVTFTTPAPQSVANADEGVFRVIDIPLSRLVDGTNTIAVEVHQQSATSSDVSFDLRLEATTGQTGPVQPSNLIAQNSTWKFMADGSNQGTAWRTLSFNDSTWSSGAGVIGRLNPGLTTTLPAAPGHITDYFRKVFTVVDKAQITGLTLHLLRDDGAVVWINGSAVARTNLPAGPTATTPASANVGGADETTYFDLTVDPAILQSLLQNGTNVIAVELHNFTTDTASGMYDASFDLSMDATVVPTGGTVSGGVPLHPGVNRVFVEAFDGLNGTGNVVDQTFIDVWYEGTNNGSFTPAVPVDLLDLVVPDSYLPGKPFLVQVRAMRNGQVQRDLWDGVVALTADRADVTLSSGQVTLRNGWGSVLVTPTGAGATAAAPFTLTASMGGKIASRALTSLAAAPVTTVSGTLPGASTTWSGVVRVTGNVTVPTGHTLTIQPGTVVLVDGVASGTAGIVILVNGKLQSLGTAADPVTVTAFDPALPWGGFRFANAQASTFQYTFISRAGNTAGLGHTGTGPAVRTTNSPVTFDHSAITDNVGKAGDMTGASLAFLDSEISRSRMGPEVYGASLLMDGSWVFDNRGPDDGDGIYLHTQGAGQTITLRGGMIGAVDDDAIDTLGATVTIDGVIVRDAKDKGVSVLDGVVTIKNSLLAGNSLASEDATFSTVSAKVSGNGGVATVNIDRTTIVANDPQGFGRDVGIESRNKYGVTSGTVNYNVTNSIITATKPVSVETPHVASTVLVSYSNLFGTNWAGTGNLNVDPRFADPINRDYRLKPGSPSVDAGNPSAGQNDQDGTRGDQGFYRNGIAGVIAPSTIPAGTLSGNTILSPENGPYTITGDVAIPAGATLFVLPGTTVYFQANTGITVNGGRIVAEGSEYDRIRFTRVPGTTGTWDGIQIRNSTLDNRLAYAVLEYGTAGVTNAGMVGVSSSRATIDHVYFDKSDRVRLNFNNASLIVRDSEFADIFPGAQPPTTDNDSEHITGTGVMAGGQLLIEGNTFGTTKGHNDAVDINGGARPGPIFVIRNNRFLGGGDDALDLGGDALIEGNWFQNFNRDAFNTDQSNGTVISAGGGFDYTMVRNTFVNNRYLATVKQDSFLTFVNNTVVGGAADGVTFAFDASDPDEDGNFGRGAYIDGNVFKTQQTLLGSFTNATQITINRSVVPSAAYLGYGTGNTTENPRFVDEALGDYSLRAGSPAIGSGPNGVDMGALVPQWASVSGEPAATVGRTSASITVGGPAITHYKYRLNTGAWSAETPVGTPINLSGLANGTYTVFVVGRNDAGQWQPEALATASRTWTVDTTRPSVRVNEVLATNNSAVPNAGTFPDLIELFNHGDAPVNLGGMSITDDPANPTKYVFPANTIINPGQHLVLYADSKTVAGQIHVGFSLKGDGEGVYLFDTPASGGAEIDGVTFGVQLDNLSVGPTADGSWALSQPTFGAANVRQRTGDGATLKINEWLTAGVDPFADDFVELYNPDPLPIAVGGYYLSDKPIPQPDKSRIPDLSFVPGNTTGSGGFGRFLADGDPEAGADHADFGLASEQGMIGVFDADKAKIDWVLYLTQRLGQSQGRTPDGGNNFQFFPQPNPGLPNPGTAVSPVGLRITEINYNPPRGSAAVSTDYEFIELKNVAGVPIDLTGVSLSGVVNFSFAGGTLGAGEYVVIVKDPAAFAQRYGTGINVGGTFTDALNDGGGQLRLLDATGAAILDFGFSDAWQPSTDGAGNTLVLIDPSGPASGWGLAASWRASAAVLGTPGIDEEAALVTPAPAVVVNEVLAHSAGNAGDWVELRNTTGADLDVSGWYLSNDAANLLKYRLPAGTVIPANGFLVLNQADSFGGPGAATPFSLNGDGGEVYLSSAVGEGVLGGFRQGASYGAAGAGVSLGRHTTSTGRVDFVPLTTGTAGAANAYPKVGPVAISEIMYNPSGPATEYIELHNAGDMPVDVGGWRFTNGIDLTFAPNTVIRPGGYLLVVPGDAAAYRQLYDVPAHVAVVGNSQGALNNGGETLELSRPGVSEVGAVDAPSIVVDRVAYGNAAPWATAPDGGGPSLSRDGHGLYGDDAANWSADAGVGADYGSAGEGATGAAPTVAGSVFYVEGNRVSFAFGKDVSASLQAGDLVLRNTTLNQTIVGLTLTYDPTTNTATWTSAGQLPDGDYTATLSGAGIVDGGGRALDGNGDGTGGDDYTVALFKFGGDATRDRTVDFNDLVKLAQNYELVGGLTWADGDFTGDGNVDFNDLVKLAQNYDVTFPAAGAPVAGPAAASFSIDWATAQAAVANPVTPVPPGTPTRPVTKPAKPTKPAPKPVVAKPATVKAPAGKAAARKATTAPAAPAVTKTPFSTAKVSRALRELLA